MPRQKCEWSLSERNLAFDHFFGTTIILFSLFFFFFFSSARLFITIYIDLWHLTILLVRSCQYVSACPKLSEYSRRFKSYSDFHKLITGVSARFDEAICKESWHLIIPLVRSCQYVSESQILPNYSKSFKVKAIFTNWLRTDGHASVRLFIKKSVILQLHWLDLVNMYLLVKHYQNSLCDI